MILHIAIKLYFFFLCRRDAQRAVSTVLELCRTRLPDNMHIPAEQIQVLTPTRKGPCGTINLNRLLQEALNPKAPGKREILWGERVFRVGDKVMQTRNNYDILWKKDGEQGTGIFNGDIGRILEINRAQMMATIDFDGRITPYPLDVLDQLELAYAITVHKSQGSEFEAVVIPILGGFEKLYYRNLLYTAVTRAKKLLILVGSRKKIEEMVHNNRRTNRYSCLRHMLMQHEQGSN